MCGDCRHEESTTSLSACHTIVSRRQGIARSARLHLPAAGLPLRTEHHGSVLSGRRRDWACPPGQRAGVARQPETTFGPRRRTCAWHNESIHIKLKATMQLTKDSRWQWANVRVTAVGELRGRRSERHRTAGNDPTRERNPHRTGSEPGLTVDCRSRFDCRTHFMGSIRLPEIERHRPNQRSATRSTGRNRPANDDLAIVRTVAKSRRPHCRSLCAYRGGSSGRKILGRLPQSQEFSS